MKPLRKIKLLWQCITRGWSDEDTWSLDYTIARFVLPRLKRFKKLNYGFPYKETAKSWDIKLDLMIYAMEVYASDELRYSSDTDWNKVDYGLKLFAEKFGDLWW